MTPCTGGDEVQPVIQAFQSPWTILHWYNF